MFSHLRNQRGQALIAMGITVLALFGLIAVALDFGHLAQAVNEIQTAADTGATAGAAALFNGTGNTLTDAQNITQQNFANGHQATLLASDVQIGTYTSSPPTFTAGGPPLNAVQVKVQEIIHNIFGVALFNAADTPYSRFATATLASTTAATPNSRGPLGVPQGGTLPLALGAAFFNAYQAGGDDCSQLPINQPLVLGVTNDTGWTSFSTAAPAQPDNNLEVFLPLGCGCATCGATPPPTLAVGTAVNFVPVTPGVNDLNILAQIANCRLAGITTFTIPVVPTTGAPLVGTANVSGFATFVVTAAVPGVGITGNLVCNAQVPGPVGNSTSNFGTGSIVLVTNQCGLSPSDPCS